MIHFISDLHLSSQTPGIARLFQAYLAGPARDAEHLYILGDLFEAWPGDDCLDEPGNAFDRAIVAGMRGLTDAGVGVSLLHGNRDFLLGARFAQETGTSLLPDPTVLSRPEGQCVLSHGDALCTADTEYQTFRKQVRSGAWRQRFLDQPLTERRALAARMRAQSETSKREKWAQPANIMDLAPAETDDFLRQHGYATFIHGHTHRPATHDHWVDGIHVERWVLSDWSEDRGEVLCWDHNGFRRESLQQAAIP